MISPLWLEHLSANKRAVKSIVVYITTAYQPAAEMSCGSVPICIAPEDDEGMDAQIKLVKQILAQVR